MELNLEQLFELKYTVTYGYSLPDEKKNYIEDFSLLNSEVAFHFLDYHGTYPQNEPCCAINYKENSIFRRQHCLIMRNRFLSCAWNIYI